MRASVCEALRKVSVRGCRAIEEDARGVLGDAGVARFSVEDVQVEVESVWPAVSPKLQAKLKPSA